MDKKWTIASIAVAILVAIKWLPLEELAKATRLLPDNIISDRAEIQFVDKEIRGAVRRYVRSEERDNGSKHSDDDLTQVSNVNEVTSGASFDAASASVRIQDYLSKSID